VIENIYAGPQGSFVPKTFSTQAGMMSLAELGFIVVQIDGMGTSNRSKAFHDVAWQNLGDAGFPDRILWHKAVAAKYAYYDLSRVGVYGTSAGGQNSAGALLFHPEFYHVGYSNSGCHDNRMDKIWWNEQWMGWPIGPHYAAASNVESAHKLKGRLMLLVPEMDTNVDPSSTMQVVNALIKANKTFELVVVPGANHGAGGPFSIRKRNDWFVKNLLGLDPPNWNQIEDGPSATTAAVAALEPDYEQLERAAFFDEEL
jgi:dipeptidyl aminopeptidase/acylaminoacyl peptidase